MTGADDSTPSDLAEVRARRARDAFADALAAAVADHDPDAPLAAVPERYPDDPDDGADGIDDTGH